MQTDRGDHKAHILGVLTAKNDDTADEPAAPRLVHQRDQAVPKLHLNGFHFQQGIDIVDILVILVFTGRCLRLLRFPPRLGLRRSLRLRDQAGQIGVLFVILDAEMGFYLIHGNDH